MTDPAVQTSATPAELLRERFSNLKRSRIRLVPVHTTRASSLGNECDRFLFYERTAHEFRTPHGEELQALFDLGNELEPYAIREIESMGVKVVQRGRDYHDREHDLTGHMDAKLEVPGWPKLVPAEIKGLNPFTAEKISTIDDIKNSRQSWVRKYYSQLQAYLYLDKSDWGVFALLNKVSGKIEFVDCPLDEEFARGLLAKADRIKEAVLRNVAPPRNQASDCARCPFRHVCLPDLDFGPGVGILDEPELVAALTKREELREAFKEYQAADKAVKELLPEQSGELLVGPFAVVGKEINRGAYSVKAGSYVKFDIRRIEKEKANE